MTCEEFLRVVYALADGELAGEPREAAEAHLSGCDACRRVHASELSLRERCARLARQEAPVALRERVRAACLAEGETAAPAPAVRAGDAARRRRLLRTWALTAAAAAAALVAIVYLTPPRVRVRTAFAAEHIRLRSSEIAHAIKGGATPEFRDRFCRAFGHEGAMPDPGRKNILGGDILRLSGRRVGAFLCHCKGRKIDVSYFVARPRDLDLSGMREVEQKGKTFYVASGCACAGKGECGRCRCQVVAWRAGEWVFALACEATEEVALEYAGRSAGVLPRDDSSKGP